MAPAKSKSGQVIQAEVALVSSLKNLFVNLPPTLVSVLVNTNTLLQNVVVELTFRASGQQADRSANAGNAQQSVFVGWTGMQSKRKLASLVGSDGLNGVRGGREQEIPVVEIDATFARLIGLDDGQKIGVQLHLDPPQAHTINIEPLTPIDWEMIELHAQFLELNFLAQVRALPNPSFTPPSESQQRPAHPIVLHLSNTSAVNVVVTSVSPIPTTNSPFVKISPDSEVIVAPKTRQKAERASGRENRSVASAGKRSTTGKSNASTVRRRSAREDTRSRGAMFLRGVTRALDAEWFDEDNSMEDVGLKVWVDNSALVTKALRGAGYVTVSVIRPPGLREPIDPQKEQEHERVPTKVVAQLARWEDPPDSRHIALSSDLCAALAVEDLVGGLVRIEAAPPQQAKKPATVKVTPFITTGTQLATGLRFGGESRAEREEAARRIKAMFGKAENKDVLGGPLTDGMFLPASKEGYEGWQGGVVKLDFGQGAGESNSGTVSWFNAGERSWSIDVQPGVAPVPVSHSRLSPSDSLPREVPVLVGIDSMIQQLMSHLLRSSSVLLTGGIGSGKTTLSQLLAHQLRSEHLYNVQSLSCASLVNDETRVGTIRDTLDRLFASAAWGARLSGKAIVVLDDLDKIAPVETELQVGNDNGRSRQISECVGTIVRQYCTRDSGVVFLATAQGKASVNNVLIGGHVVREIVHVNAPTKDARRKVLEKVVNSGGPQRSKTKELTNGDAKERGDWHDDASIGSEQKIADQPQDGYGGMVIDRRVDLLELAGQTDGYMPGDLTLLVSRARNEALIRTISSPDYEETDSSTIVLRKEDFDSALKGFTPASLRNVTLQSSTTRWDSIGGLHSTRQMLLETLQYPTTYAPIFAQCPLRLRSGILLYGYPGCGKTLLASAVAGECGLNFISVKGPEILNKYIGASEKSVRDLFERAEAARPCVLFFDEFDSIAPKRGHDSTGVTDRVVNQLLTQMDGAEGLSGVYVLAATSRPDLIDPALLRPGRLDKSLICDLPPLEERIDILTAVTRKLRLSQSILTTGNEGQNLRSIASRTEGYSGADLQAVVYNAQLEAIHDVLGDTQILTDQPARGKGSLNADGKKDTSATTGVPPFTYFRYDEDLTKPSSTTSTAAIAERAQIAAKLSALQNLRRKQKAAQQAAVAASQPAKSYHMRSHSSDSNPSQDGREAAEEKEDGTGEPMIKWKHIDAALGSSRSSISRQERRRLEGIYREFVVGRNGELPNGQGGTEIGGRASLA